MVGGESLLTSVYKFYNTSAPLSPCLQKTSQPSLAFLKYDLATAPRKLVNRPFRKKAASTGSKKSKGTSIAKQSGASTKFYSKAGEPKFKVKSPAKKVSFSPASCGQMVSGKKLLPSAKVAKNKPNFDKMSSKLIREKNQTKRNRKSLNASCETQLKSCKKIGIAGNPHSVDDEERKIVSCLNNGQELKPGMVLVSKLLNRQEKILISAHHTIKE